MDVNDKLLKPIVETKYLNVENTDRYRTIIRFFYQQYEKLKYWMYQEEVYEELISYEYFNEYTLEQCQQDLSALVEWKNLLTMQDTKKVSTIEEFKNKKFRYQLSEYSVEIERMVIKLENLFIEGASLEPTLLERIRVHISKITDIYRNDISEVYSWWNDLNNDFIRLNQNYQDYMRDLNSLKAEEMMKTKEFLLFKDKLIEYLRGFVKGLQVNVGVIEQKIKSTPQEVLDTIFAKVLEYELSIPRIDAEIIEDQLIERIKGRFQSVKEWFVDTNGMGAESEKVFDTTNEIIRKITRYAARISELNNSGANRKEEYNKVASMFARCRDMNEAHKLSASVFGIEQPIHLKGDMSRATESINSGVYEEEPYEVIVTPRIRNYREKAKRSAIIDRSKEKEKMKKQMLRRIQREEKVLNGYIKDNRLDFAHLPVIGPETRNTFLTWLSKALENKSKTAKTEDGREYQVLDPVNKSRCIVECTDGTFEMPSYRIVFETSE